MNLQKGIWYVVTKGSNCGTFRSGDRISLLHDGAIMVDGQGWLDRDDVPGAIAGMKAELDKRWLAKKRERLERELKALNDAQNND